MKTFVSNRKAHFDFEVLDTFEAGIILAGHEVKSIKLGRGKLEGGHIIIRGGEAFLINVSIPLYQSTNIPKNYDPEHLRKLLLSKKELAELETKEKQSGLTIIPIRLYNKSSKIKLEIAIVRGKKKHDKREVLKKRDSKRDIERTLKNQ